MEVTIHPKDFSNLLRCLSLLNNNSNDVEIRGGILRQRSNNNACIFEMDLTPLVSDCDLVLSNIKSKLSLLKALSKQEVKVTAIDNDIFFSGERSTFKFEMPRIDFMDNKFISGEEFARIFTLREEDVVLEYALGKDIFSLMKVTSGQFKIASFQISFEGSTAAIIATNTNKSHYCKIEQGIPIKKPFKGFSNLVVTPFLIDHDGDILLKMYNFQETVCVNKFKTLVGKITVVVCGRSQLIEESEPDTSESNRENSTHGVDPSD